MFQLDDNFLKDLGLDALPEEQKQAFLQHIYEELELRVGTKLSEGLSEPQMLEFEAFIEQDEAKVTGWLAGNLPDYAQRDDYRQMRQNAPADVPELAVMAEYASLKWLELNRPDYRQVVADQLEKLKKEISSNRDAILSQ